MIHTDGNPTICFRGSMQVGPDSELESLRSEVAELKKENASLRSELAESERISEMRRSEGERLCSEEKTLREWVHELNARVDELEKLDYAEPFRNSRRGWLDWTGKR